MFVVALRDGGTLIYSPTWLGDDGTFARVEAVGTPRVLLAPNHFHHLSLARFRARYPEVDCRKCEIGEFPRLEAKGHRGLRDVIEVEGLLPSGSRVLCPGGGFAPAKPGCPWGSTSAARARFWSATPVVSCSR